MLLVIRSAAKDAVTPNDEHDIARPLERLDGAQFCTPGLIERASAVIAAISNRSSSTVIMIVVVGYVDALIFDEQAKQFSFGDARRDGRTALFPFKAKRPILIELSGHRTRP